MTDTANHNVVSILDEHTANRIAAGEVIERPASVVKELVENSIDAGATQVRVNLEDGGKELIQIIDNGSGMTREDAVVALQRHATSKIRSADDLFAIRTLGFRGEALPSIASVSTMEVVSKHISDATATRLEVEAGTIRNLESVGAPEGTTMSVRRIFFNTPARLKFLKTAQTELSHITELVGRFALSYPSVSFRLTHGGKEVMSVTGTGEVLGAAASVYGRDVAKHLVPISFEVPSLKISGYVSKPDFTRANRGHQVFFVNGRCVRNKTMTHAADQAYRDMIVQQGRYPVLIIFVEMDPGMVDVNVHPTKSEVKFSSDQEIHGVLYKAVREALMTGGAIPIVTESRQARGPVPTQSQRPPSPQQPLLPAPTESDMHSFREAIASRSRAEDDPFDWSATTPASRSETSATSQSEGTDVVAARQQSQETDVVAARRGGLPDSEGAIETPAMVRLRNVRVLAQARNMYILAESDDGVLIIDQHVAHERVLYEQLKKTRHGGNAVMQGLVIPITLELSRREGLVVTERLDDLRSIGFDIEPFGKDAFVVRAAPADVKPKDAEPLLRDIISELVETSVARHLLVRPEQVLITTACKMAIKAGDPMTMHEMDDLIRRLIATENPFVCPHGRPVIVSLTNWELDRKFKRPTV